MKNALLHDEQTRPAHSLRPTDKSGCKNLRQILPCTESFWTLSGVEPPCTICEGKMRHARRDKGYESMGQEFFFSPSHMDKTAISAARAKHLGFAHFHDKYKASLS